MISWRYHLVSIVAVFLALGLGVLAGTTVLDQGLVNTLRSQTTELRKDLDDLRQTVTEQRRDLATLTAFGEQALPYLVSDRLFGRPVVIVTQDGVEDATLAEARRALDLSGANILTTLTVRAEMVADDPSTRAELAGIVGMPETSAPDELAAAAAGELAQRLATAPGAAGADDDLLGDLLSAGFVTAGQPAISDASLAQIGGPGQIVVVIGGGPADVAPPPASFLVPLTTSLVTLGMTTAAAEGLAAEAGFVPAVREEVDADTQPLATVDDADLPIGGAALVLGIQEVVLSGTGGDYGVGDGASRLLPSPA
ncbi:MAG TPA: copper transporter [Actinomycetota bacterium]